STALGNHICSSTGTGVFRDVNGGAVYNWRWRLGAITDFPSKIADGSIKGTPRDHVCIGVMETALGQLSVRGGAREVCHSHAGKKDHEGNDNKERRCLFGGSPRRRRSRHYWPH